MVVETVGVSIGIEATGALVVVKASGDSIGAVTLDVSMVAEASCASNVRLRNLG